MAAKRDESSPHESRRSSALRRRALVERWYGAIAPHAFSPFAIPDVLAWLDTLTQRSVAILTAASFDANAAEEIGATLVRLRYHDPTPLGATISVLGEGLGEFVSNTSCGALHGRLPAFLGAVAKGHARATRTLLLNEQEGVRAALLVERGHIAATLRESEERYREVFANATMGIALVGLDGRAVEWNTAVERILGYSSAEMSRLHFTDITHPDDVAGDHASFERLVAAGYGSYHMQKRYRHKQGHVVSCNLTASLLRDAQGNPRYVLGMIEDVTARRYTNFEPSMAPPRLTERERAVLQRLAEGLTREQVQAVESMSLRTVNRVVAALERKLDAPNVFALGARAAQLGLVPPPVNQTGP